MIAPVISTLRLNDIQKTFANFTVSASEPCYVYYMVALKGTRVPSTELLSRSGFNETLYNYTKNKTTVLVPSSDLLAPATGLQKSSN